MRYTIPCDFKINTIEQLWEISQKYPSASIAEVYGDIPELSPIGSGRGYISSDVRSLEGLKEYIGCITEKNIQFNYTINAACTENKELSSDGQKAIIQRMDKLMSYNINRFTVASTSLAKFLKYVYGEDINITLSAITNIDSVRRAQFAESLGVDTIVLGEDETRNFFLINQIHQNVNCRIEIIVNSMCLWNCIFRQSHYNSLAHCNNPGDTSSMFFTNQCSMINKERMEENIRSPWIRPEDVVVYEKAGVNLFKFIGREMVNTADWNKMFEIYCREDYDGNLLELLNGFTSKQKVYIDNKSLNGFIDHFVNGHFKCKELCGTSKCEYCKTFLKKSLRNL